MTISSLATRQHSDIIINEIKHSFLFLQKELHYKKIAIRKQYKGLSSDFTEVTFSSKSNYIRFFYGHMEATLSIEIGSLKLLKNNPYSFNAIKLEDALLFCDFNIELPANYNYLRSESDIRNRIDFLASIFKNKLYTPISDETIILQWIELKNSDKKRKAIETNLISKRESAQIAWEQKEYAKVISIYSSFSNLTKIEQKRLNLSEKYLETHNTLL